MCLITDEYITRKLKNSKKKTIYGYKELSINVNGDLISKYYKHTWKPGINKSDNNQYMHWEKPINVVFSGMHVYRKGGKNRLKVTCKLKNLMGANKYEAAFTEVFLTKREYNRYRSMKIKE